MVVTTKLFIILALNFIYDDISIYKKQSTEILYVHL